MTIEILSAIILLTLVTDPFGNVPLVNAMLAGVPQPRRRLVILRECAIAFVVLMVFMLGGLRMSRRLYREIPWTARTKRILIYGAGDGGEMIARDMHHNSFYEYEPIGLLDDVLAGLQVRTTFFVQGRWAEAYPALARRVATDGHLVGHHSHYHVRMVGLSGRFGGYGFGHGHSGMGLIGVVLVVLVVLKLLRKI